MLARPSNATVTEKVLDILAMERQDDRDEMRGASKSIATRVKALYLCRDNIARFLEDHAEIEGDVAIILRQQWASDQLPVVTLDAGNEPAQMIDDGSQLGPTRAREYTRRSRPRKPHRGQPRHKRDNHLHRSQDTSD